MTRAIGSSSPVRAVKWSKEPILYTCHPASPEEQMSGPIAVRRHRRVAAAMVAAASLASVAPTALAATCGPGSITIDLADVAFVGTMTAVDSAGMQATFAVDEVWKGDVPAAVAVTGPAGQQWTDPSMAGARYLVLATVVGGGLRVGEGCNLPYLWDPSMAAARPAAAHPPTDRDAVLVLPIELIIIAGAVLLLATVSILAFRSPPKAVD
jgi:uncharacterized metal-binding protein